MISILTEVVCKTQREICNMLVEEWAHEFADIKEKIELIFNF